MRPEKKIIVAELTEKLKKANPVIVTRYSGLTAQNMNRLRDLSNEHNSDYMVVKNTLLQIAAKEAKMEGLPATMTGNTAILFGGGNPVALAKIFVQFAKENEALKIEGAVLDSKPLTKQNLELLATLPPREVLLAKLFGQMKAPISNLVGVLAALLRNLVNVMNQIKEQKEKMTPQASS